jgi:hypothetical protein
MSEPGNIVYVFFAVEAEVERGFEVCLGVGVRVQGFAPSIIFEAFESFASVVREVLDRCVKVEETKVDCFPIQGRV